MKNEILKLREEGKSYGEIANILGCSKSTISYYCGKDQKEKTLICSRRFKELNPVKEKFNTFNTISRKKITDACKDFKTQDSVKISLNQVLEKFGENPKCYLTGRKIDWNDKKSYSFDHIIPVSKGGLGSIDNLGLCCPEANRAKSNLLFEEFLELCKEVLENAGYKVA